MKYIESRTHDNDDPHGDILHDGNWPMLYLNPLQMGDFVTCFGNEYAEKYCIAIKPVPLK